MLLIYGLQILVVYFVVYTFCILLTVAKRKSLFDDKPVEIQELTYIIKEDINSLNKQIAQLQQIARSQHGQNGRQTQSHSNTVVVALQVSTLQAYSQPVMYVFTYCLTVKH